MGLRVLRGIQNFILIWHPGNAGSFFGMSVDVNSCRRRVAALVVVVVVVVLLERARPDLGATSLALVDAQEEAVEAPRLFRLQCRTHVVSRGSYQRPLS